jgi:hypothetical protein
MFTGVLKSSIFYSRKLDCDIYGVKSANIETRWGGGEERSVKLSTNLSLVPRLRIRGTTSLLRQYVFVVWCLIKQKMRLHG